MTEDDSKDIDSLIRNWRALDVIEQIEYNKVGKAINLTTVRSFPESPDFFHI